MRVGTEGIEGLAKAVRGLANWDFCSLSDSAMGSSLSISAAGSLVVLSETFDLLSSKPTARVLNTEAGVV